MKHYLLKNYKNIYDNKLFEIYKKNYKHDLVFSTEFRYNCILFESDIWYHIINDVEDIIAVCSIKFQSDGYCQIDDVFVEEKFRGNDYSFLLLINVLNDMGNHNKFKIFTYSNNIPAIRTYKKIFGEPISNLDDKLYFYLK